MTKIISEYKKLFNEFKINEILKSILFGLVFGLFIFTPIILILINLCYIYIDKIILLLFLINIVVTFMFIVITYQTYNTLITYKQEHNINIRYLLKVDIIVTTIIVFITLSILIVIIAPKYIV